MATLEFVFYLFILMASFKQGSLYGSKMFWVWTAFGLMLLGGQHLVAMQYDGNGKPEIEVKDTAKDIT